MANALLDAGSKLGPALGTLLGGTPAGQPSAGACSSSRSASPACCGWCRGSVLDARACEPCVPDRTHRRPATLEILAQRSAWGTFLGHFCGNYFWFFLLTWLPTYLVERARLHHRSMVSVTSIAYFAIAAATMLRRLDLRPLDRAAAARPRACAKPSWSSGSAAPPSFCRSPSVQRPIPPLTLLLLLACVAFGTYTSNHWAITQTLAGPLAAGRWTSLQNGIGNLSGIVASWLTGVVVDRTGSFVARLRGRRRAWRSRARCCGARSSGPVAAGRMEEREASHDTRAASSAPATSSTTRWCIPPKMRRGAPPPSSKPSSRISAATAPTRRSRWRSWASPVRLLGAVGCDEQGRFLLDVCAAPAWTPRAVTIVAAPTAATVALVNAAGDRKFLHRIGRQRRAFAEPLEFTPALIDGMAHYHLASIFILPRLPHRMRPQPWPAPAPPDSPPRSIPTGTRRAAGCRISALPAASRFPLHE